MKGVVSAGHSLTAKAGIQMLKDGGNAFDAALAACFASFVCESPLTSIGGGGFFMAHDSAGETLLYDFFPNVPGLGKDVRKESLDFYPVDINFGGTIQEFHIGKGAVAVPGCMAGLAEVFERHCSLPLKVLLDPAIDYAAKGVVLNKEQASFKEILSPILTLSEAGRKVYSPQGVLLKEGERIVKSDMAETLQYLAYEGLNAFYTGEISEKILSHFGDGGLITRKDLENYRVEVRRPLEINYRGKKIYSNPPPSSSGGCLLAFSLKLIEGYDLGKMDQNSAEALELIYQVMELTDEARGEDFDHKVYERDIVDTFLAEDRIESYRQRIGLDLNSNSDYERPSTGNTTHISVVDEMGNAASVTTSNGEGCGHMIPGAGVMLNNMLGEEDINPHGFHTQPAGSRMSSMMAPTIVMDGNYPSLVLGSGGSNRIKNAIFQVILNMIDHKMAAHDAVNSARAHWDKKVFQIEPGPHADVLDKLQNVGIPVNSWEKKNMYFGGVHTVVAGDAVAGLTGAGDLRRGGVCLSV